MAFKVSSQIFLAISALFTWPMSMVAVPLVFVLVSPMRDRTFAYNYTALRKSLYFLASMPMSRVFRMSTGMSAFNPTTFMESMTG